MPVHMGSHGIGVSRLVGALIEANHDDKGIVWPEGVTPFHVGIVNLKQGDHACDAESLSLYAGLRRAGLDPLYDDRDERAGAKFATMDLIGLPWRITVGPRGLARGRGGACLAADRRERGAVARRGAGPLQRGLRRGGVRPGRHAAGPASPSLRKIRGAASAQSSLSPLT